MRFGRFVFLLLLLLALSGASAEVFRLPESFAVIESEAFSDVSGVEEIYVPETCVRLAPDAFGSGSLTVYGFRGSAGETFARESGNEFVDVGIYDISYSFDGCLYTLLPIKLNISFDSPVPAEITDISLISAESTLPAGTELIPGDILVSAYSHVVMFLYYADDAHTQIVIIEQGGDEYGTGTVNVNTRSLSYYTGRGYIARRYSSWRYFDYAKEDGLSTAGK